MTCAILKNALRARVAGNIANNNQNDNQLGLHQDDNNPGEGHAQRGSEAVRLQREYLNQYLIGSGAIYFQMNMILKVEM